MATLPSGTLFHSAPPMASVGIPDALQGLQATSGVLQASQHVHFQGVRIPYYSPFQLQVLPPSVLRSHAEHVFATLAPSSSLNNVPAQDHHLVDWLSHLQGAHLAPLLGNGTDTVALSPAPQAVLFAVPDVHWNGVPIPLYENHHLRALPLTLLQMLADYLQRTLGAAAMNMGAVPTTEPELV